MKTDLNPSALYWASFNRLEIRLPGEAVSDIAHSGDNGPAVDHWQDRAEISAWDPAAMAWSNSPEITAAAIRAELAEYGAWDETELSDDAANLSRIVWIAAWNIAEDETLDCSEPLAA